MNINVEGRNTYTCSLSFQVNNNHTGSHFCLLMLLAGYDSLLAYYPNLQSS